MGGGDAISLLRMIGLRSFMCLYSDGSARSNLADVVLARETPIGMWPEQPARLAR
jgi:hypothetical protein